MKRKPDHIDPLADRILQALACMPEAAEIVLGGYVVLQHYIDYRKTHDIDAWWKTRSSSTAQEAIRKVMQRIAAEEGSELRERHFGDTISFELLRGSKKHFSFQISIRSMVLEPPQTSFWPPILMETLYDNIGSKMNALVDRGSPRDFSDIKETVGRGLATVAQCWELWSKKNPGVSIDAAKQKVLLHLSALEHRRPLNHIGNMEERTAIEKTRTWFKRELLGLA